MIDERLKKQIEFIVEIDKLKHIFRQTILMNKSRNENDAEHSWHLAVMAILLSEYAAEKNIDVQRVVKMVLIHDLVEIDAGDTFCYDEKGNEDKACREQKAADRIFNMLPSDQAKEIRDLWDEFEERISPEARFAAALDRLQPLIHNYNTDGHTWTKHNISSDMIIARNQPIEEGAPALWEYAKKMIREYVDKGVIK
ncbi:HD domain-containing protein [Petroclostridium sp. X23]|uniref:HD domain-containing protein n=1 Tax=Petroclostridium sp. X23 TaxID=3045146 RepID=UPI0024ADEF77|nr:HD domain-containing protein [Petroclostridium sp. X23]WHH61211.1 HD domain-containing protein [Petroclostridium sp. X23]